jgi:hypothetical protein
MHLHGSANPECIQIPTRRNLACNRMSLASANGHGRFRLADDRPVEVDLLRIRRRPPRTAPTAPRAASLRRRRRDVRLTDSRPEGVDLRDRLSGRATGRSRPGPAETLIPSSRQTETEPLPFVRAPQTESSASVGLDPPAVRGERAVLADEDDHADLVAGLEVRQDGAFRHGRRARSTTAPSKPSPFFARKMPSSWTSLERPVSCMPVDQTRSPDRPRSTTTRSPERDRFRLPASPRPQPLSPAVAGLCAAPPFVRYRPTITRSWRASPG